ncbi:MAG TPA: beta-galactosidase [Nevskiaceae bacterium]|nr:beta-galactosidase [Nevskiaceae bacterium]
MSKSSYPHKLTNSLKKLPGWFAVYWRRNAWHKLVFIIVSLSLLCLGTMYGLARWYIASEQSKPLVVGATFIPAYAESLGLDAKQTMDALLNDLHIKHLRLVSYWDQLEPTPGQYDFSLLDWQFQKAEAAGSKVSLSLGLRQPRWPECHQPAWAGGLPASERDAQLAAFIQTVVQRYKNSPSLDSYQLENEFFLKGFGICTNYDRQRLINEFNIVKATDPQHTVIISRSNNALGMPVGQPTPDEFGISIYKRVWDATLTHRYIEYPFPAWYYAFLAGTQKILTGRDMVIHELQAEAWPPNGKSITEISLDEQNKSLNAQRLKDRFQFGRATGMRTMDMWGAEYWYYRLTIKQDPSLWNTAKAAFRQ